MERFSIPSLALELIPTSYKEAVLAKPLLTLALALSLNNAVTESFSLVLLVSPCTYFLETSEHLNARLTVQRRTMF